MLVVFILSMVLVIKRSIEVMWSSDGAQALLRHLVFVLTTVIVIMFDQVMWSSDSA